MPNEGHGNVSQIKMLKPVPNQKRPLPKPADVKQWWYWMATMEDGAVYVQYDHAGREISVDTLDRDHVKKFSLIPFCPPRCQRVDVLLDLANEERFLGYWLVNVQGAVQERRWVVGIERGGVTFLHILDSECNVFITTNEDAAFI